MSSPTPLPAPDRDLRMLSGLAILCIALAAAFAFSMNLVDPDLWGHVQYGEDLLADGALPATATHTFTAPDHPWINHENLAEVAFAAGFRTLGVPGMLVVKCLWGLAIIGLMLLAARRLGVAPITAWGVALLVAIALGAFFPMRPQLLSFMCCAVCLYLLELGFKRPDAEPGDTVRWAPLAVLPVVMVVWTNSHGGFVAGLGIVMAYLMGRALEAIVRGRPLAWRTALGLGAVAAATAASTLANPYGYGLHQWIRRSLGSPRPEISEWASTKLTDPVFVPMLLLFGATLLCVAFTRRRRDWVELAILALVAWQAVTHVRHISFLAILCGFWLPVHLQSIINHVRSSAASTLPDVRLAPWIKWTAASALWGALALQSYALGNRLVDLPVYRHMYPVDAVQFMSERGVSGRLVVAFNWAQYALAALPECPVAFDGRFRTCYPQEVVDMHFDFLIGEHGGQRFRSPKSGPIDGARVLAFAEPELVLVGRESEEAVKNLEAAAAGTPGWTLLYQDRLAQVWGRSDLYNDPASPRYLPVDQRIIGEHYSLTSRQWPALPMQAPTAAPVTPAPVARTENQSTES
ncbi:hypothetical protein Pla175_47910 [Pirellulimonas nuda]|uniref:Glycosyltransferase RgtA/B/C/D-like domain-containing protein n=1 Tax=Pirellulimonas nuda TaxID=2528009 RepID=A0A518DIR0_9BACT|nr:hypothetical protein [Pirellulimonas nuda]QDU91369.1 hypothetical protein Pla175_47910 [Pirellulimonas nuda]